MCQKILLLFFVGLLFGGCNKEIESTLAPPFAVFPNPCYGSISFRLDNSVPGSATVNLYDRDGSMLHTLTLTAASPITSFPFKEEGIYYLEANIGGTIFKEEILNLK